MCFITFLVFLVSNDIPVGQELFNLAFVSKLLTIVIMVAIISGVAFFYFRTGLLKWWIIFSDMFEINQLLKLSVTSLLVYSSAIGVYYYAFVASSVEITSAQVVFIMFLSFIAKFIPFSVLGVTAGELILVIVSGYFGVSHELALMTVMIIVLGKYIFSMFGFLVELYCDGLSVISESLKISTKSN